MLATSRGSLDSKLWFNSINFSSYHNNSCPCPNPPPSHQHMLLELPALSLWEPMWEKGPCPPNIRDLCSDHCLLLLVTGTKRWAATVVAPPPHQLFKAPLPPAKVTSRGFKGLPLHCFLFLLLGDINDYDIQNNCIYRENSKVTARAQEKAQKRPKKTLKFILQTDPQHRPKIQKQ